MFTALYGQLSSIKKTMDEIARTRENVSEKGKNGFKLTKQEIKTMPESIRKIFIANNYIVNYRITSNGYFEARIRRKGMYIPSPMKKVVLPAYQTKKGEALTKNEETRLVNYCKSHKNVEGTDALLLCLFELKFLRVVRVHCGGDRAAQRVARPDADDLACNAGLFTTADEGVAQLVRVVVRQQSLHARGNGVEVGVLRFLKVDIGECLFHLRCERNLPKHDILPQPFLARFTL